MHAKSDFVDYILNDLLGSVRGITSRNMFGGTALFREGKTFGMIVDDELYFKVGPSSIDRYKQAGSRPFTYSHNGKEYAMSYWTVPPDVLDDRNEFLVWADIALQDQLESKPRKTKK